MLVISFFQFLYVHNKLDSVMESHTNWIIIISSLSIFSYNYTLSTYRTCRISSYPFFYTIFMKLMFALFYLAAFIFNFL